MTLIARMLMMVLLKPARVVDWNMTGMTVMTVMTGDCVEYRGLIISNCFQNHINFCYIPIRIGILFYHQLFLIFYIWLIIHFPCSHIVMYIVLSIIKNLDRILWNTSWNAWCSYVSYNPDRISCSYVSYKS